MITVYSNDHYLQDGKAELHDGKLVSCFEMPRRAELVLARVKSVDLGPIPPPQPFGLDAVRRVHAPDFVDFLGTAWSAWTAEHGDHDALPLNWLAPGMRRKLPDHIDGKLGYYSFDAGTPITAGTWRAITAAANVALTGARLVADGENGAFALCRPPGHHAGQALRDRGAGRVAVLDIDYHHGNGTQDIFYDRSDVFFASLHADPMREYPYFLGYADETGSGGGRGVHRQLSAALGNRLGSLCRGAGPRTPPNRRFRHRGAGGLARGGYVQGRPDLEIPARQPRLP